MREDLDLQLGRLAQAGPDARLSRLEATLRGRLVMERELVRASALATTLRVASVGLAMIIGFTAGGLAAAQGEQSATGSGLMGQSGDLAPSRLLDTSE